MLWSSWAGIGSTIGGDIVAVRQIKLSDNSEQLVMATELMGSVKFWELAMKVENCQESVMLYKVMGGGVHDFSFSKWQGPILKYPLVVGSKMICLGCS